MTKTIEVSLLESISDTVTVNYNIESNENTETIHCNIEGKNLPLWLQLRKFSITSLRNKNKYQQLYNEINCSKNMDTALFIDTVYSSIMSLEIRQN